MQHDYHLCVINGREVETALLSDYQKIYEHWHSVWSQTFKEVSETAALFSDNFTRQDEIIAVMKDGKCVSAVCHRLFDFRTKAARNDSYFEAWPDDAFERLGKNGPTVVIAGQLSVDPAYRRTQNGLRLSELTTYLSLGRLEKLKVDGISIAARNSRGMDSLFKVYSPETLREEITLHGEPTSLFGLYPPTMTSSAVPLQIQKLAKELWSQATMSQFLHPIFKTNVQGENNVNKTAA
ncbi:hypothetical protein [Bdellovibrio sp. HCB2-146]|uniref:hypothetical protein n=1 Tax=Bdellovibrio sp. HCB2-146 TaxID=3394362 RepID=UPI0039BC789C